MKKEYELVFSRYLGTAPIMIDSALVSAQTRKRNYWVNFAQKQYGLFGDTFTDIPQPKDRGILLKDILEKEVAEKYYLSDIALKRILRKQYSDVQINPKKTGTINTKNNSGQISVDSGTTLISDRGNSGSIKINNSGKSEPLSAHDGCAWDMAIIDVDGFEKNNQEKASCFTAGGHSDGLHSDMDLILRDGRDNRNSLRAGRKTELEIKGKSIRRLTEIECCRLQNVPDDYFIKDGKPIISSTQQYKCLGNGWSINTIVHILSYADLK